MGVLRRYNKYIGLDKIEVLVDDTAAISQYFNAVEIPDTISQGRSSFLVGGSPFLKSEVEVKIEIINNATKKTIYTEAISNYLEGEHRRVSIEIYSDPDTFGDATMYMVSELKAISYPYYEVIEFLNDGILATRVDEDGTRNTNVYDPIEVTSNPPPPDGAITVPIEWQNNYNVRWQKPIYINGAAINAQPIFFYKQPRMWVGEIVKGYVTQTQTTGSVIDSGSASGDPIPGTEGEEPQVDKDTVGREFAGVKDDYQSKVMGGGGKNAGIGSRGRPVKRSSPEVSNYTIISDDINGKLEHVGAKMTLTNITPKDDKYSGANYIIPVSHSTVVRKVANEKTMEITDPVKVWNISDQKYELMQVKTSNVAIEYTPPPVQAESTVNFRSFADVRISNLRTFSGDINRVKLYSRNKDAFGDFELIADTPIESPELLFDNFSVAASQRTGYFITQNMINTYWSSGSGDTLTRDSSIMLDAMKISGSNYNKKSYALAQYTSSIDFIENTTYNFRARIVGVGANSEEAKESRLSIHISGSGFPSNHDLGPELGWQMETPDGELGYYSNKGLERFDFGIVEEAFKSNPSGSATIQLVAWSGQWYVQDLSIRPATDTGFNPDWIRIIAPVPPFSMERPDEYEFITEFYDVNNNVAETIAHISSSTFQGGNQYILGTDNILSGSMVIGNAVGAGIEMAGFSSGFIRSVGYEGFLSASQGSGWAGFMMYSGSVLPNSGDNYDGVGLELVSPGGSGSLRFSTNPSRFEVIAESFYVGSPTSQFISGSGGSIEISSSAFWLQPDGSVIISGSITAGSGYIGGWEIIPGALYNQTGTDFTGMSTAGNTRFFAGATSLSDSGSGVFNVKSDGDITGSQVLFTGGKIGGFDITSSQINSTNNNLILLDSGQITGSTVLFTGGKIGGFDITSSQINSTNNNLILLDSGQITGSTVLFTGGKIGGFDITASQINSTNDNLILLDSGQITGSTVLFTGGKIGGFDITSSQINSTNDNLILLDSGQITGSTVLFTGGKIGGWDITTTHLVDDGNILKLDPDGQYIISSSNFQVSSTGEMTASAGLIGGWNIGDTTLSGTNLILNSAGRIETGDYASGIRGWRIDESGEAEFENAHIRGTLSTVTFEKQSINAVGGQLWIANSSAISGSAVGISETTMSVVNASGFTADEYLLTKKVTPTGFSQEIMTVISASIDNVDTGAGRIMVTRGTSGSAAAYDEGQVLVSTGRLNTGYIKLNANPSDESTPYIDIVERTGSAYPDFELKARLGDLSGLSAGLVGANPGYGLFSQNVFLTGTITANAGNIGGFGISGDAMYGSNFYLSGSATGNGFFLSSSNFNIKASGDITGSDVLFTGGKIANWAITTSSLSNQNVSLVASDQGYSGLFIEDDYAQDMVVVADKPMYILGSATDEVINDSFEADAPGIWGTDGYHIGTGAAPLGVVSWSLAVNGPISHSITHRDGAAFTKYNAAVTGLKTFDIVYPGRDAPAAALSRSMGQTSASYNTLNNYEFTQIVSASSQANQNWIEGNVVSFAFVGKMSHSMAGIGYDRAFQQQTYKVDYWDSGSSQWIKFIPKSTSVTSAKYNLGTRYTSIKASNQLPVTTDKLRIVLSGSFNRDIQQKSEEDLYAEVRAEVLQFFGFSSLAPDSLLTLNGGAGTVTIKEARVGTEIQAWNPTSGLNENVKVGTIVKDYSTDIYTINHSGGADLTLTGLHQVRLIGGTWANVEDITDSDTLVDNAGAPISITSITPKTDQIEVYNVTLLNDKGEILDYGAYANGVLVYNEANPSVPDESKVETITIGSDDSAKYPYTEISFDNFRLVQDTARVEMSKDGFLMYQSEVSYIKMTPSEFIIRTPSDGTMGVGNAVTSNLATTNTGVYGQLAAPSLQPYEAEPADIGTTPFAGGINEYSMGNHRHDLTFDTLNVVIGQGTVSNLDVLNLTVNGGGTGSFNLTGSLHVNSSADSYFIGGGNVGIGTATPARLLHIRGGNDNQLDIDNDGSTYTSVYLKNNGTQKGIWWWDNSAAEIMFGGGVTGAELKLTSGNSVVAMTIDSSQNVGIGTLTPGALLQVQGDAIFTGTVTAQEFHAEFVSSSIIYESGSTKFGDTMDDVHWRTGSMYISGSSHHILGYVGIGVTTPTYKLDVEDSGGVPFRIKRTNVGEIRFSLESQDPRIIFNDGSGAGTDEWTIGYANGVTDFIFATGNSVATNQKMTIQSGGNVGIGTTNPNATLAVYGNTTLTGSLGISTTIKAPNIGTGVDNSVIVLEADGTFGTDEIDSRVWGSTLVDGAGNTPQITYWSDANTITGTSTFVYSGGKVGIGTTAPDYALDVNGDIRIENAHYMRFGGSGASDSQWAIQTYNGEADLNFAEVGVADGRLYLEAGGNIGIGTTNPTSILDVRASSAHSILTIHADNGYGSQIQFDTGNTAKINAYNGNGVAADRTLSFQVGGNVYQHIKNNGRIGINTTSPLSQLHIRGHVSQSHSGSLFRVEGSSGSLFEVIDSLEGSLLSVNDISGLPILEVFSDDRVVMGSFNQNTLVVTGSKVGIGTDSPTVSLDVSGSIRISEAGGTFEIPTTQQIFLDGTGHNTYLREYSADLIQFVAGGNSALWIDNTKIYLDNAAGPAMLDEAATSTNPTLVPNRADVDTGIGWIGTNVLSLVAGGANVFNIDTAGMYSGTSGGGKFLDLASTSTVPVFVPDYSDTNTGIGWAGADTGSLIAGGTNVLNWNSSGYVGIGVTNPTAPLDIEKPGNAGKDLTLRMKNSSGYGSVNFYMDYSGDFGYANGKAFEIQLETFPLIQLAIDNGATAGKVIFPNGNVGIGTATPQSELHVWGDISGSNLYVDTITTDSQIVSGSLIVSGSITISKNNSQLLLPLSNDATTPTLAFGDGDSGFYENADDQIYLSIAGSERWKIFDDTFGGALSNAPALLNEAASSTNPTLIPNRGDDDTGIGWSSSNALSLITGGAHRLLIQSDGDVQLMTTTAQLQLPISNDATTPTLAFGDGDTGFYEASDDSMWYASAGVARWKSDSTYLLSTVTGDKPTIVNEIATSTNPVFTFYGDTDTGIGLAGADTGSLIAGGTNVLNWNSDGYVGIGTVNPTIQLQIDAGSTDYVGAFISDDDSYITIGKGVSGADNRLEIHYDGGSNYGALRISGDAAGLGLNITDGGSVGIGTTNPEELFHVMGGGVIIDHGDGTNYPLIIRNSEPSASSDAQLVFQTDNGSVDFGKIGDNSSGNLDFGISAPIADLTLSDSSGETIRLTGGLVGIGTNNPTYNLEVAGTMGIDEHIYHNDDSDTYIRFLNDRMILVAGGHAILDYDEDATSTLHFDSAGAADVSIHTTDFFVGGTEGSYSGKVGIGMTTPDGKLEIQAASNGSGYGLHVNTTSRTSGEDYIWFGDDTGPNLVINTSNRVGIGTAAPSSTLHVWGTISGSALDIAGTTTLAGDIIPSADDTYNLGSSTKRWAEVHATTTLTGGTLESGLKTEGIGKYKEGTVLVWRKGKLIPCNKKYDNTVQGVVHKEFDMPLVLGAEKVRMTGKIKEGDFITTSNKEGRGMKYNPTKKYLLITHHEPGTIIAQALEDGKGDDYVILAMVRKF